jgi:signal-transduction protein with cAMP-binding, CBS, and nucleotidyltransferase domain
MSTKPITVDPTTPIRQIAEIMAKKNIGSIIVTENEKPIGVVTERDIVTRVIAKGLDPEKTTVREIMSQPLITVTPDTDLSEAMRMMSRLKIRRLVVINNGKLVGMVTETDILSVAPELIDLLYETSRVVAPVYAVETFSGYCDMCNRWTENLIEVDGMFLCEECRKEYLKQEEE